MGHWFNTAQKFGSLSKGLHWVVGLVIIGMLCVGLYMTGLENGHAFKSTLYLTHKSLGLIILPIAIVWFILWFGQKKPEALKEIPKPLHRLSKLVHAILIVAAVLMPLSGWIMSSAFSGQGVSIFNFFTIPAIASYDPEFARAVLGFHILISWILMGASGLHILATLYHHFIRKNIILKRMLPFVKPLKTVKKVKKPSNVHHLGRK